jgi:hypothetical protein
MYRFPEGCDACSKGQIVDTDKRSPRDIAGGLRAAFHYSFTAGANSSEVCKCQPTDDVALITCRP